MSVVISHVSRQHEVDVFIERFAKEVAENNAAIFAGAGLSVASGFVNWKELLRSIASELRLNIDKEEDRLVSVAQYYQNHHRSRHRLNQLLIEKFSEGHKINSNHRILARLPIQTYWTTNYDRLLEHSLEDAGKIVDAKYDVAQLSNTRPKREAIVYKMHGDVEQPDKAVLTKDDYERYHIDRGAFINLLSGDFVSKTFLFLGFGFTDPNIDYVLARVRATWKDNQREHWCIVRTVQRAPSDSQASFQYKRLKQHYFIKDLERFNIRTILVNDYADITHLLERIEDVFRRKTVFVSGSAHEYGSWSRQEAEQFLACLGTSIVKADNNVVTGFGLGVGSAIVSGALNEVLSDPRKRSMSQLLMRPFPQVAGRDAAEKKALWTKYREEMIAYAGIIVMVFGNKQEDGKTVLAAGVEEEFRLSIKRGLVPIPVGATGYMAEKLHKRVMNNFGTYYPRASLTFKKCLASLGNGSTKPNALLRRVVRAIELVQRM